MIDVNPSCAYRRTFFQTLSTEPQVVSTTTQPSAVVSDEPSDCGMLAVGGVGIRIIGCMDMLVSSGSAPGTATGSSTPRPTSPGRSP